MNAVIPGKSAVPNNWSKANAPCCQYSFLVSCVRTALRMEHRVNHVAPATDRTKVSADVIQLAHEVDPAPEQAMSEGDASDSEGSESASDSDQNDPPSSLG